MLNPTVKIRCGLCRRIFHEVDEQSYMRVPQARQPLKVVRAAPLRRPPELSLSLPTGMRMLETEPGRGGRLQYTCHPRHCLDEAGRPRTRTVTFDRYTRKVEAAFDSGKDELLLFRDL
jgi:hypothetical protein